MARRRAASLRDTGRFVVRDDRVNVAPCRDGYRFAKRHGKSAIHECGKSANGGPFHQTGENRGARRSDSIHRDT
jgi:hypothetical protein